MSPYPRRGRRRAARPSWADHIPRRRLPDHLLRPLPAQVSIVVVRRSAVAVLTATALLGAGAYTATTLTTQDQSPVTVLGLTATGTCDNRKAARQHAAATETRTQARALLTDLTLSDDPDDHALADQITELGFRPATQPPGWRQHAVDLSDHLHHLDSADPHSADPNSADPQLSEVGVRLAAAGLGPTPADLINPPPAADLITDTATGATVALSAIDQALAAATTPPPAAATPPVERPVERPRTAAPPIPAACTDHHPATPTAPPEQPPAGEKTDPTREPAPAATTSSSTDRAADTTDLAPTSTKPDSTDPGSAPGGPRTSTPPAASNRVVTDAQTGPEKTSSAEDVTTDAAAARAAIGMVSDLMAAIAADGGADATRIGSRVLDALDTDRLAALGADPADLDTLDHLRDTTTSGSSGRSDQPTTANPPPPPASTPKSKPTQAQAQAQTSSGETDVRPGAAITRTQPSQSSRTSTTTTAATADASGDESSDASGAGQHTSTSTPETQTRSPGSVSAGIEKLRTQARAAAEVDPVAQDLLDALDRTGAGAGAGAEDSKDGGEHGVERGRISGSTGGTASTRNDTADDDTADGAGGLARGAGEQPPGTRAEPPPATGDAETDPATGSTFDTLAQCESGGDWSTNTGNGFSGGLQFSPSTWRAFGGEGAAHEASRDEQIEVAKRVQAVQGWKAWLACSQRLGLR